MLRRFSTNFALFSIFLDGFSVVLSLRLSVLLRPLLNQFDIFEKVIVTVPFPYQLYVFFPTIWLLIFVVLSIYDGKKYLRVVDEFSAVSLAVFIASISSAGVLYFSLRQVSRALFLLFVLFAYFMLILWRLFVRLYFRSQKNVIEHNRRVIIVGAGALGQRISSQIKESGSGNLSFVGFVDDGLEGIQFMLGGKAAIKEIVIREKISDVVIALPYSAYPDMAMIVQSLEKEPVRLWVALGFFDLALYKTEIENFADIPMLDLRASAIDDYQRLIKRVFDFFLASIGLVLISPLMVLITLAILMEDGWPVLFCQKRVGENGRIFSMLKFRTMVKNAEELQSQVEQRDAAGNILHKTRDDPRITRVGRVLRRLSLDEFPQLINVLNGTMSLVGPRPEMPYLVDKYQPWQRKRFAVPPGMTGWWQISGRSDRPMHLHTEDDLYYIQNYSIWLDIQILVRTVWVVLIGRGSY
ncbi:MAG: sugar transferase [Leptolinea sp.]|jgi:exopolysaccharide biosynthesis polyprenyl glycosylphosphotransferase|nr:sugar transferase [Leptolinea sp.]